MTTASLDEAIVRKLQRWQQLGEAPEYYALRNRGPSRPTVASKFNRFGGQMGPYVDAQLQLESVDYINASPIDNLGSDVPRFVATMCPKRTTFAHFWSMVWEVGCTVIINLTHEKDRVGSEATDKRERYWPPFDADMTAQARGWAVQPRCCGSEACEQVPGLQRFDIELSKQGEEQTRKAAIYWYCKWVDFPTSSSIGSRPFYANAWNVLHVALHVAKRLQDDTAGGWSVCHCSAGVGRTGTFIALLKVLSTLPELGGEERLDELVTETIELMRERRLWMVKTDIEYALLYAATLLRLRNPRDEEFLLSWRGEPGSSAPAATAAGHEVDNDADVGRYQ